MKRFATGIRAALGTAALLAVAPAAAGDEAADAAATRASMDRIFERIRLLLPQSLDAGRFGDPQRREEILAALDALAADGAVLADHGRQRDASFGFLSRSLARDTQDARDRYAAGQPAEARFLLLQLTEDCVACHSRLPSPGGFAGGEAFVTREQIASLPLEQRAALETATRQFERALASYEALFAAPEQSPASFDLEGLLDDYLELCLRVADDRERALGTLEKLLARGDLPASMRTSVEGWTAALRALDAAPPQGPALESARALIAAAELRSPGPDDRRALVEYVTASGILQRQIASAGRPGPDVAEAYYLLGVIESRIGRSFWLSQTEDFLETAIRLDPGQPWAADAYALLEEFVVSGYSGSSGEHVPPDVRQRLDELRRLIQTRPAPAASAPTS